MMNGAVTSERKAGPSGKAAFTSQQKLTKATEFSRVFNNPFVSSDACFKVLACTSERQNSRLGMAVSRQVDKRAVGRNRIKRVVRESFRLNYSANRVHLDVVVLPRRETATMCNERLFDSLKRHWSRLENQFEGK
jgi:ribonuclease P protein component